MAHVAHVACHLSLSGWIKGVKCKKQAILKLVAIAQTPVEITFSSCFFTQVSTIIRQVVHSFYLFRSLFPVIWLFPVTANILLIYHSNTYCIKMVVSMISFSWSSNAVCYIRTRRIYLLRPFPLLMGSETEVKDRNLTIRDR